jgi:predicted AAA+ superfamily ATPase
MIITGLRGVGKTVLLSQFRKKALERSWVVVELEVSKHDDSEFRRNLSTKLSSALFNFHPRCGGPLDSTTLPLF